MYRIVDKIRERSDDPWGKDPATAVFLGDSVTNGCFEVEFDGERYLPVYDEEHSYTALFRRMIKHLYPKTQLNVINSGISGDSAEGGLSRLGRDVLSYHPDLVVVCFGLNDCTRGLEALSDYRNNLTEIVKRVKATGADVILMTPSDITDSAHHSLRTEREKRDGERLAGLHKEGVLGEYVKTVREVAREQNAGLVDCYAIWQALIEKGVSVNGILSNKLNHPTREMHLVFAYEIMRELFYNA